MEDKNTEGKSVVRFTEWKIEGTSGSVLNCVKYVTVTTDGVQGPAEKARTVRVPRPDLTGADLEPAVRTCFRFGFSVQAMIDECRKAEYERMAAEYRKALIEEDKRNGD